MDSLWSSTTGYLDAELISALAGPCTETFCGARTAVNKSVVFPKAIVEEVPFY